MSPVTERVIAELWKRPREKLTVLLREQDEATFCDVRLHVLAAGGQWRPTKHGVTLEPGRLGELIGALRLAQEQWAGCPEATRAEDDGNRHDNAA